MNVAGTPTKKKVLDLMSHKFIHDSESKDSMYDYLEISLLRSVVVPDPLRKTVISAEVSRLFRILDMKSGSTVGG